LSAYYDIEHVDVAACYSNQLTYRLQPTLIETNSDILHHERAHETSEWQLEH
jgi:hypothetical protein